MKSEFINVFVDHVYCIGDIHGDFEGIIRTVEKFELRNSALVFCGDCGFGFNSRYYYDDIVDKLIKMSNRYNDYIFFIRGNHDEPSYFKAKVYHGDRVYTLSDYTVIRWHPLSEKMISDTVASSSSINILCVGGAISVDRIYRKKNESYWDDEEPIYDEKALDEIYHKIHNIDYVCTHTVPSFCEVNTKQGLSVFLHTDKFLYKDLDREREVMDKIFDYIKKYNTHPLSKWFYGHFHLHKTFVMCDVAFHLLDMSRLGRFDMEEIIT